MIRCSCAAALALLATVLVVQPAAAQLKAAPGDWPAFRGPDRNGISTETGLLKKWPPGGPKLLWKATGLGGGYSTPSVANGRIYLIGSKGNAEYLLALDAAKEGNKIWEIKIGTVAEVGYAGPRSTPTVDGDLIFAMSSNGDLVCVDTAGKEKWKKKYSDFGGIYGKWGYAESPLVDGDVLVCTPGGSDATLLALKKQTGEVLWKSPVPGGDKAAYASVIVAETDGIKQYVQFLADGVVGVSAKDGTFLWRYKNSANGTANIPTPIFSDRYVFSVSGYSKGGGLVKLTADNGKVNAAQVYANKNMVNQLGGFVLVGGYVYGAGGNDLVCLDFMTGKVQWKDKAVGSKASVTYADGCIYARGENGPVAVVEANPKRYVELGRFDQPDRSKKEAWPYPVIAHGCLYLRDQGVLLCYDIKQR